MAMSVVDSNSTTPSLSTDTQLYTTTTAGTYVCRVSLANLANGETFIVRVQVKERSGVSLATLYEEPYYGAQGVPIIETPPIVSPVEVRFSIEQQGGTARAFSWSVTKIAD